MHMHLLHTRACIYNFQRLLLVCRLLHYYSGYTTALLQWLLGLMAVGDGEGGVTVGVTGDTYQTPDA